jgi:hypothetical protein
MGQKTKAANFDAGLTCKINCYNWGDCQLVSYIFQLQDDSTISNLIFWWLTSCKHDKCLENKSFVDSNFLQKPWVFHIYHIYVRLNPGTHHRGMGFLSMVRSSKNPTGSSQLGGPSSWRCTAFRNSEGPSSYPRLVLSSIDVLFPLKKPL